jgi:predicted hotdog family 3-hydroxylacyl-ACP dehydratase
VAYPALGSILPHRPPMILIDELVHCGERDVVCAVTVRRDAPFVADGRVPALVSLEYFAQTVAAFYGYLSRNTDQFTMGMLLGTRELELLTDFFHVGDALTVTGHELWSGGQLAQFRCELLRGPERLALASISVLHVGAPS